MPRKKKTDVAAENAAAEAVVEQATADADAAASGDDDTVDIVGADGFIAVEVDTEGNAAEGARDPSSDDESFDDEETPDAHLGDRAITFRLDDQLYGMPISVVQEIQQIAELQPLPDEDPALVGLIDLRGTVVPVLDLRVLVGLVRKPYSLETPMIFCRSRDHLVCLVVETVEDVVDLASCSIQPPSSLYSLADRMLGVCRLPQGLVLLLDIEKLIPGAALAIADQMGGGVA